MQCAGVQLSFCSLVPAGSVYRDEFDLAILKMQEDNRLEILKRKWWDGGKCPKEEDHRAKGLSPANPHLLVLRLHFSVSPRVWNNTLVISVSFLTFSSSTNPSSCHLSPYHSHFSYHILSSPGLGMENIGGIFVVLVCGLLVAIFMAVLEFVWMLRQTPGNEVREGYLTCICFISLSPPRYPPRRRAARLSNFQI